MFSTSAVLNKKFYANAHEKRDNIDLKLQSVQSAK